MRKEYLFEELSSIDTDLILEAAPCENKKRTSRKTSHRRKRKHSSKGKKHLKVEVKVHHRY